ncbi:DUF6980 family protein [Anaerosolibacter sp.]|uniref:DUF6980 family protein n=1 Tax=Anaerosolibacter sp. TaxID=1872527 RepID=UPI0039EF08B9
MRKHCCETMEHQVNYKCEQHANPSECPDKLIFFNDKFDEYGIIFHDGGPSYSTISFCPWCGSELPESKRDLWFDTLEELGFDDPVEQEIPEEFKSDSWYRNQK